jgi:hypothetical protein
MVGIAGEDDLDAPPDASNDPADGHKASDAGLVPNPTPEPVGPSQPHTGKATNPPVGVNLCADESAAISAQLIREIETVPGDDLQTRAIAILKAKSRAAIATKPTSSSWHRSRVWFAAEAPPTPTTYGSPSRARWGARSVTSSRYRCAELTTATIIASVTRSPGGADRPLIQSELHGSSGFRRVVSNETLR